MRPTSRLKPGAIPRLGLPDLGCGVGLRVPHYAHIFEAWPKTDFFEIISENFLVDGGRPLDNLAQTLERYPVVQHGVSLGIGASTPLDWRYLERLRALTRVTKTPWVTDHLCWTRTPATDTTRSVDLHDLLPLPYTEEAVRHVAGRVRQVQDFLELPVGLENTSSYMTFRDSTMTEWEFLSAVVEEANCGILLDVNNVYVSAYNHGFSARDYLDAIPHDRVIQIHLAGHTNKGAYILDTHSDFVIDEVWSLYRYACSQLGPVTTLIEWDDEIPDFSVVRAEARKAEIIRDEVERERAA
ncbi:MAG: DUF692 domain-containing protein [Myxococcales bacterium]|nr:DUF692 domain-containing protein [Myxococcales bacterium]